MTVRASPIQTLTVGTGISPIQPFAAGTNLLVSSGLRVADYNRRFGLTPTPEHVCVLLLCHNCRGSQAIPDPRRNMWMLPSGPSGRGLSRLPETVDGSGRILVPVDR